MDGFTVVLLIGWLILLGAFGGMYYMDQAAKKREEKQAGEPPQRIVRGG